MTDRRPWGSLERAQIIDAAIELARKEGVEALTIRRLAAEVGASRMGLYRHVADKEALLDLVANEVAMRQVIPDEALSGPWEERLRRLAHSMRDVLRQYPGLVDRVMSRANAGPGGVRIADTIADIFAAADLDDVAAARYFLIFVDLVFGRVQRELQGDPTTPRRNAELFVAAEASRDAERLKALLPSLRAVTPDEIFDAELDMVISAIRATAR
ncbi:regulatory protein, tetR family [Nonomuraea solani]|uniref:Regulatory protein, tetR family n=1 Tax=Nonomuraea solani TaxID=1144553 RepID=A0A1H6BQH5_9ACTN|nr:TetR family transcriptional regulator [Nonomuraea solani]SEG62958.1 regulatory protein, tetR family [Nonomuraea solani]